MTLWITSTIALICIAIFVFAVRRNPSTLFIVSEWCVSFIISLLFIYDYFVFGSYHYVIGPVIPVVLFMIFSLYLKIKPVKHLLYSYMAFWCVSFSNYLLTHLQYEELNGFLIVGLKTFSHDTYFFFTVTIMLTQIYIGYKVDRRGNINRDNSDNFVPGKHLFDGVGYPRV